MFEIIKQMVLITSGLNSGTEPYYVKYSYYYNKNGLTEEDGVLNQYDSVTA